MFTLNIYLASFTLEIRDWVIISTLHAHVCNSNDWSSTSSNVPSKKEKKNLNGKTFWLLYAKFFFKWMNFDDDAEQEEDKEATFLLSRYGKWLCKGLWFVTFRLLPIVHPVLIYRGNLSIGFQSLPISPSRTASSGHVLWATGHCVWNRLQRKEGEDVVVISIGKLSTNRKRASQMWRRKDRKEVSVMLRILKTEYFLFHLTRHFWIIELENI